MPSDLVGKWPAFTQEEADAVQRVLLSNKTNYWTGSEGRDFEREFAASVGTEYAVAVANGTLALDVSLKAVAIQPGDEVVVTPRSFFASASCIVNAGGIPIFAEIDCDSQNITADTIRDVLSQRTTAIICVHLAGWPCDMDPILQLASQRGLFVIEDCAQAHGAKYKGRSVGSIGHVGAWSFCQDKIMTTGGEGGMVTTNDRSFWETMWSFKDHGKSWEAVYERQHAPGFRWLHESFGTNSRLTEMQSAIGRIQLQRLPDWHHRRQSNAVRLIEVLKKHDIIRLPLPPGDCEHGWYRLYGFVRADRLAAGWSRDRIVQEISSRGIPCQQGSCSEIYREKAFVDAGLQPTTPLPIARELGETSIAFLVHPTLTEEDLQRAVFVIDKVLTSAAIDVV